MERKLLVATTNVKKGGEMVAILSVAGLGVEILTLADLPPMPSVDETGETFMANAHLKAESGLAHTGMVTVADDGGLVIDALDGLPGVKSHRFLGEQTSFADKMARILELMHDVPDVRRTCRFQCAVVIAAPDGQRIECCGVCEGRIAHEMRGVYGFGYDPIVLLPELGRHMAELAPEEKHRVSHRGRALACAVPSLREIFQRESFKATERNSIKTEGMKTEG
jgi:XTP/dITP diphosphohydrolase